MLPDGFYPEKAMTNESKITLQVRSACLSLWEACLPLFFKSNNMFETLGILLRLEGDLIQANAYSFWFNLLINRIAQYISHALGTLLHYDVKEIFRVRSDSSEGLSPISPVSDEDSCSRKIPMFVSRNLDRQCIYVGVRGGE